MRVKTKINSSLYLPLPPPNVCLLPPGGDAIPALLPSHEPDQHDASPRRAARRRTRTHRDAGKSEGDDAKIAVPAGK